jgi:hypothetical protein
MLTQDVQAYLAVRRAMGFGMKWSGNLLRGFAAFSDATGQYHVCSHSRPNSLFDDIPHIEDIGHNATLSLDAHLRSDPGRSKCLARFCHAAVRVTESHIS